MRMRKCPQPILSLIHGGCAGGGRETDIESYRRTQMNSRADGYCAGDQLCSQPKHVHARATGVFFLCETRMSHRLGSDTAHIVRLSL